VLQHFEAVALGFHGRLVYRCPAQPIDYPASDAVGQLEHVGEESTVDRVRPGFLTGGVRM